MRSLFQPPGTVNQDRRGVCLLTRLNHVESRSCVTFEKHGAEISFQEPGRCLRHLLHVLFVCEEVIFRRACFEVTPRDVMLLDFRPFKLRLVVIGCTMLRQKSLMNAGPLAPYPYIQLHAFESSLRLISIRN